MKRLLLATSLLALTASAGLAADLGRGYSLKDDRDAGPRAFSWTGLYVGANVNYSWADVSVRNNLNPNDGVPPGPFNYDTQGLGGGVSIGANYQIPSSMVVVGVEAEGGWLGVAGKASKANSPASSQAPLFQTIDLDGGMYGTLSARFGLALIDRALFYGKVGYTWTDITAGQTTPKAGYVTHRTDALQGLTFGGGVEYAMTERVTLRVEYLHYDFGKSIGDQENVGDVSSPPNYKFTNSHDVTADSVKLGVNFKF